MGGDSEKSRETRSIPSEPSPAQEERERAWQQPGLSGSSSKLSVVFPRLTSPPPQHCNFTGKGIRATSCPPPPHPRSPLPLAPLLRVAAPRTAAIPGASCAAACMQWGRCLGKTKFLAVGFIGRLGGGGGLPPVRRFPSRALGPSRQTLAPNSFPCVVLCLGALCASPLVPNCFRLFFLLTCVLRTCPVGHRFAFTMFFFPGEGVR